MKEAKKKYKVSLEIKTGYGPYIIAYIVRALTEEEACQRAKDKGYSNYVFVSSIQINDVREVLS